MQEEIPPPQGFVASIVPLVFSSDDPLPLPPALLSTSTAQAVHFLSLSPQDQDSYWTLGTKDPATALARRAIVEAGSLESIEIGIPQYSYDLSGELKALLPISLPHHETPLINFLLVWEEKNSTSSPGSLEQAESIGENDRPSWTFLKLESLPNNGFEAIRSNGNSSGTAAGDSKRIWYPTMTEAMDAINPPNATSVNSRTNRPSGLDFSDNPQHSYDRSDDFDEEVDDYGVRRRAGTNGIGNGNGGDAKKFKTREEMAEGEGTTPGAYGDSADFWAGWSDSEGEEEDHLANGRGRDTEREETNGEDSYWNEYNKVEDQVDDGRAESPVDTSMLSTNSSQPPAPPRPQPVDPASASTSNDPSRPKTRSRRSSTVTPFSARPLTSLSSESATDESAKNPRSYTSFLSLESPSQSSAPFHPRTPTTTTTSMGTNGSVNGTIPPGSQNVTTESTGTKQEGTERDEFLRMSIKGLWELYRSGGDSAGKGLEDSKKRFAEVVEQVLSEY